MSYRPVESPECPVIISCGTTIAESNWSAVVKSIHAIHEAGQVIFTGNCVRTDLSFPGGASQIVPLVGYYGPTITLSATLSQSFPIEIFPGYTSFSLITSQKLRGVPGAYMIVNYYISNGTSQSLLASYTSATIGNGLVSQATTGTLSTTIVPGIGNSVQGYLIVEVLSGTGGSVVTPLGSPSQYFGCIAATLKQFKPC